MCVVLVYGAFCVFVTLLCVRRRMSEQVLINLVKRGDYEVVESILDEGICVDASDWVGVNRRVCLRLLCV